MSTFICSHARHVANVLMVLAYGRKPAEASPALTPIMFASAMPTLVYRSGNCSPKPVSSPPMSESTQNTRGSRSASSPRTRR